MMENYDQSFEINHNPKWPYILDHIYRILIIGGSGSGKTNLLLNLVKHQQIDIGKIYLYVKDPFESKYQLRINGRENVGIKQTKNPVSFIDYFQTIDDIYQNLENYNPRKKNRKVLLVFDDMTVDMETNKQMVPKVTELFLRGKKLNIFLVFIWHSCFEVP